MQPAPSRISCFTVDSPRVATSGPDTNDASDRKLARHVRALTFCTVASTCHKFFPDTARCRQLRESSRRYNSLEAIGPYDRCSEQPLAYASICNLPFLATTSVAISGCGGSAPSAHRAISSAGTPITKAKASAYARAVNLRAGDPPFASVFEAEHEGKDTRLTAREAACLHGAHKVIRDHRVISRHSATLGWNLQGEFERFDSAVEVLPNVGLMIQHNAASRSRRALACASRIVPSVLGRRTGHVEFGPVSVSRLADPLPGIDGAYEYRIATTIIVGARRPSNWPTTRLCKLNDFRSIWTYSDSFQGRPKSIWPQWARRGQLLKRGGSTASSSL